MLILSRKCNCKWATLTIFFLILFVTPITFMSVKSSINYTSADNKQNTKETPTISSPSDPAIDINGDADFASQALANGWSGDGSAGLPYRIENLTINLNETTDNGIDIQNTRVHFIIQNCTIHNGTNVDCIQLQNVTNALVQNNTLYNHGNGIDTIASENITITNNTLYDLFIGVSLSRTNHTRVILNRITSAVILLCQYGAYYVGGFTQCYLFNQNVLIVFFAFFFQFSISLFKFFKLLTFFIDFLFRFIFFSFSL